jgi:predicted Rossmann-fold nucleotide-binding protein
VPAEQIGAAIAAEGWTLMTGGYGGLMEVTSRAAAQAGGRVVGLPMRGWTALTPNQWSHELRWSDSYPERLAHLLGADAIVAVDGGIGTLSEAALAWSALQTEPVAADLIFLGAGWPPVLRSFADHLVIDERDLVQVTVYANAQEVIAHIAQNEPRQPRVAGPRG